MATLDKHADVSAALAMQLEGAAILADLSTEELLTELLDKWGKKVRRTQRTLAIREVIEERHAEGDSDSAIARFLGVAQQTISRNRAEMGLEANYAGRFPKQA